MCYIVTLLGDDPDIIELVSVFYNNLAGLSV